jgi:hypothetical protein
LPVNAVLWNPLAPQLAVEARWAQLATDEVLRLRGSEDSPVLRSVLVEQL